MIEQKPNSSQEQHNGISLNTLGTGTSRTGIVATFIALSGFSLFGCGSSNKAPDPEIQSLLNGGRADPTTEIIPTSDVVQLKDALTALSKRLDLIGRDLTRLGAGGYSLDSTFHKNLIQELARASDATLTEIFREQTDTTVTCPERLTQLMTLNSHLSALKGIFATQETFGDATQRIGGFHQGNFEGRTSNSNPAVFYSAKGYIEAFIAADGAR